MKVDIRKPTEDDLARFKECLAADSDHAKQDADEWTAAPGEFMVFYSGEHRVWVRIERVLRISLQHDHVSPRGAVARIFNAGFRWMVGQARQSGYSEVILESRAPRLVQFITKLFGFVRLKGQYGVRT